MRRIKRTFRMMAVLSLAALPVLWGSVSAFAAGSADLDLSREGSITLSLYSEEAGAFVTDGVLTLYEVAEITLKGGNLEYAKTEGFLEFEGSLDVDEEGLAGALAGFASETGAAGTEEKVSAEGSAEFDALSPGLYLIVQTVKSDGYYPIEPFLVTVPMEREGVWVYTVEASPKVEVYPEPVTPAGPGTGTPAVTETPAGTVTPLSPKLPQTGQLFWPIPLMAGCGALLFLTGALFKRKRKEKSVET